MTRYLVQNYPGHHLLCIGYRGDHVQLGLSETAKTTDTPDSIIDRALEEELCVRVRGAPMRNRNRVWTPVYQKTNHNFGVHVVQIPVTHPFQIQQLDRTELPPCSNKDDYADRRHSKVLVFLHGPLDVLEEAFPSFHTTEEGIESIHLIPITSLSQCFIFLGDRGKFVEEIPHRQLIMAELLVGEARAGDTLPSWVPRAW